MDKIRLKQDLINSEGLVTTAYRDSLGFWTAGVGHLLDQSKDWTGHVFEMSEAIQWLSEDIDKALDIAHSLVEWPRLMTEARQNAVTELVFNMGLKHWESFKHTRDALFAQDWQLAHDGLLASLWAKQVHTTRATRIANYILLGVFT